MWWPSAKEPENSEEEQGEPSRSDVSATPLSADETLRSLTDEVLSSGSVSSSGEEQSCSHTSESKVESEKPTTCSEEGDQQPELSDSQKVENKLSKRWIRHLQCKKTRSEGQSDSSLHSEIPPASEEELRALQSFCAVKINLIHHRGDSKAKKGSSRRKKLQIRLDARTPQVDALNCAVPDELLNRMYLKNTRATLKHMAATKQHISAQCPSCTSKRAELAQSDFLKRKKTLLESLLLQEKTDEHLYTTDFLTRVAEAHQGLPRLSDEPTNIWKRLTEKIKIRSFGVEGADAKQV